MWCICIYITRLSKLTSYLPHSKELMLNCEAHGRKCSWRMCHLLRFVLSCVVKEMASLPPRRRKYFLVCCMLHERDFLRVPCFGIHLVTVVRYSASNFTELRG